MRETNIYIYLRRLTVTMLQVRAEAASVQHAIVNICSIPKFFRRAYISSFLFV